MTRIPTLVRSTAKRCQQYYAPQMAPAMLALRSMSTAQHAPPPHDTLPPKIKNTFGANFDWKDPLRVKRLLADEEVCSLCIIVSFLISSRYEFSIHFLHRRYDKQQNKPGGSPRSGPFLLPTRIATKYPTLQSA